MNNKVKYISICALVLSLVILCAAVLGCAPTLKNPAGQKTKSDATEKSEGLDGTYWKAVEYEGEDITADEFWSDLFLWEDGTGYFRFSQASAESNYYGFRDVFDCGWILDGGSLTLTETKTASAAAYAGTLEREGRLMIEYDGFFGESFTIIMEQAKMPSYGAQWEIPELYGTWRMVSYSDPDGDFALAESDREIYSEIAIYPTFHAELQLSDIIHYSQAEYELYIEYKDGAIWDGAANRAWHVELCGASLSGQRYYAAFADGKLLFMQINDMYEDATFPLSFAAEYEWVGFDVPLSNPHGFFSPKAGDENGETEREQIDGLWEKLAGVWRWIDEDGVPGGEFFVYFGRDGEKKPIFYRVWGFEDEMYQYDLSDYSKGRIAAWQYKNGPISIWEYAGKTFDEAYGY
ncbi:MAG: hypothetical protein FWD23_06020 [Oscillospiraceae bacterium]|nr:hypothetical protein [Oscillospiraceae bacterium]